MDMQFTDYTMDFKPFIADKNTWSWIAGKTEFPSNDSDTRCEVSWGDSSRENQKAPSKNFLSCVCRHEGDDCSLR